MKSSPYCVSGDTGMAMIILTGELEAIPLSALHGVEVVEIDKMKQKVNEDNGGYADWTIEQRRGIFSLYHIARSYIGEAKQMFVNRQQHRITT